MKKRMNKGLIILIILFAVGLVIAGYYTWNLINKVSKDSCAFAGEVSSNPTISPEFNIVKKCCNGLVEISDALRYLPNDEGADENGCVMALGAGIICSDCGNGNCESWENKCNCPEDCP